MKTQFKKSNDLLRTSIRTILLISSVICGSYAVAYDNYPSDNTDDYEAYVVTPTGDSDIQALQDLLKQKAGGRTILPGVMSAPNVQWASGVAYSVNKSQQNIAFAIDTDTQYTLTKSANGVVTFAPTNLGDEENKKQSVSFALPTLSDDGKTITFTDISKDANGNETRTTKTATIPTLSQDGKTINFGDKRFTDTDTQYTFEEVTDNDGQKSLKITNNNSQESKTISLGSSANGGNGGTTITDATNGNGNSVSLDSLEIGKDSGITLTGDNGKKIIGVDSIADDAIAADAKAQDVSSVLTQNGSKIVNGNTLNQALEANRVSVNNQKVQNTPNFVDSKGISFEAQDTGDISLNTTDLTLEDLAKANNDKDGIGKNVVNVNTLNTALASTGSNLTFDGEKVANPNLVGDNGIQVKAAKDANGNNTGDVVIGLGDEIYFGADANGEGGVRVGANGISAGNQRIQNVADPVADTDAVNKRYVDNWGGQLNHRIEKLEDRAYAGIASAAALAAIPQSHDYGKHTIGVGVGGYSNKHAVAIGYSYNTTNNWKFKGGISANGERVLWNAGVGYTW